DDGDALPPDRAPLGLGEGEQVGPTETDGTTGDDGGRHVQDAHDRLGGHTLTGARFAQDGQRLAAVHRETDIVDGFDDARAGVELDLEVFHLEQGAGVI